jgi:hypothetical protein
MLDLKSNIWGAEQMGNDGIYMVLQAAPYRLRALRKKLLLFNIHFAELREHLQLLPLLLQA